MSPNNQAYTFEKEMLAPASQVYQAFTNSTFARQWLSDNAIINARPGGHIFLVWNSGFYSSGEFVELIPDKKVVFTWSGRNEPGQTRIEVDLFEKGENTQVILKHSGIGAGEEWNQMVAELQEGWASGMENLASLLETGEDLRFTRRPMLGIGLNDFNAEIAQQLGVPVNEGLRIDSTIEGMGAQTAGLQSNDVIVAMGGYKVINFSDLATVLQRHRAGDPVEVQFYRGPEKRTVTMTLSGRPMPTLANTIGELADQAKARYAQINHDIDSFLEDVSQEEAAHKPAPAEWRIMDVLAHLIYDERAIQSFIAEVVCSREPHYDEYPSNQEFTNQATIAVYPTLSAIHQELKHAFQETTELYAHLPESFLPNKQGFWRLAYSVADQPIHYQAHLDQMRSALKSAREN